MDRQLPQELCKLPVEDAGRLHDLSTGVEYIAVLGDPSHERQEAKHISGGGGIK